MMNQWAAVVISTVIGVSLLWLSLWGIAKLNAKQEAREDEALLKVSEEIKKLNSIKEVDEYLDSLLELKTNPFLTPRTKPIVAMQYGYLRGVRRMLKQIDDAYTTPCSPPQN